MAEVSDRTTRAMAWLTLAGLAVLVAGVVYLRPALGSPSLRGASAPAPVSTAAPRGASPIPVSASFRDADHGIVNFLGGPSLLQRTGATYMTADGGHTWKKLLSEPGYAFFASAALVVSHTASRTRISEDGGRTWRVLSDPRPSRSSDSTTAAFDAPPVFLDPEHGWWLAPPAGLWRTRDGGSTWTALSATGIPADGSVAELTFTDPSHGFITFAPTAADAEHLALATEDGGDSWHRILSVAAPIPDALVLEFVLFPHGSRLIVALDAVEGLTINARGNGFTISPPNAQIANHVFTLLSNDGGQTWSPPWPGPGMARSAEAGLNAVLPDVDGGRLVLLLGHRLLTSIDGGATWSARVTVMPEGLYPTSPAQVVPGAMYVEASASAGPDFIPVRPAAPARFLLRSRDGGIHWEQVPLPPAPS